VAVGAAESSDLRVIGIDKNPSMPTAGDERIMTCIRDAEAIKSGENAGSVRRPACMTEGDCWVVRPVSEATVMLPKRMPVCF